MTNQNQLKTEIDVPFPSPRLADIVYNVLRVDLEPKRSGVTKQLILEDNKLHITFTALRARQLRVAVTNFFENLNLIVETFECVGEPVGDTYDHY